MATKNHHVIRRSRIEVTVDQHSANSTLQHTIHKVIQQRIIPILSKLFSKYVPNDVIIHLDKLVIDGGSLHLSTLSTQLPYQVEKALTLKLKEQIAKVMHHPTLHQVMPLPDATRQAIAHYLSEGNFAWWMVERSEKQIEKIYLDLLYHTPLRIEQLWGNLNKKEKAVQRCMALFSQTTVEHTLSCLLKQPIAYWKPILAETGILLRQEGILTNLLPTPEQQLLAMALLGIINQQRPKVDRMGFLNMLLRQVAVQTSISYDKILERLHTYYMQNDSKHSYSQVTKPLVLQLRDMVVTPPKFWNKDVKNKENILKKLDTISNSTMAFYQLSAAISDIKLAIDQPGIRPLVKNWLQEESNRTKLVKILPDTLFIAFLENIDPYMVSLFSDCMQIATATTATTATSTATTAIAAIVPTYVIKVLTLACCTFENAKTLYCKEIESLFRKYIANGVMDKQRFETLLTTQTYHPTITSIMVPLVSMSNTKRAVPANPLLPIIQGSYVQDIPGSKKLLKQLEAVIITFAQTTQCQVTMDWVSHIFMIAAIEKPLTTENEYIARIVHYLAFHTPFSTNIVCNRLSNIAAQAGYQDLVKHFARLAPLSPHLIAADHHIAKAYLAPASLDSLQTKYTSHYLASDPISVVKNPLSDVVDFLAYNELPKDQLVPSYVIAQCLRNATPQEIWDALMPLCQEGAILKKLMQHATDVTLSKLLEAFIPFSNQLLEALERVIIESKILQNREPQTNIRLIKEIFITAAVIYKLPKTEKQYIACILCHLSTQVSCAPTTLCDQLMDAAKQVTDYHLVEAFALLKENVAPLHLNKIDEVDLIFLSTHETFALDKALLPFYYSRLLPAIKHMVRASVSDLSQPVIGQLVAAHLPTISKPLQETIGLALYHQITDVVQSKKKQVAQRWYRFLHTGKLGHYGNATALLNDVMMHLPTVSLAQHNTHVRQRLIANFTHTQLMLLVQRHSHIGQALANFIQASYQLWCATQGALGAQNITKNLFWDVVLKTLPQTAIAEDDWLAQITTEWSNLLAITPTTLVATFQLLIQDTKGVPEAEKFTTSLDILQEKYRKEIQQQAIQHGYKAPILTKLYVLLNGHLSLFTQQYHLEMDTLGNQLVQVIADHPFALSKFLEAQDNHSLVARRMVHYLSKEVTTKIIAYLAKDKALFVTHYIDLLSHPRQHPTTQLHDLSTWQNELYVSIIHYLISKSQFDATDFVHSTLRTTCYPKEALYTIITSSVAIRATNQEEDKIITLLKSLIRRINPSTIGQLTAANHPLEGIAVTRQKASSKKVSVPESVPEAEVRVYTKNTGLVFLWPFFYDFFNVHHLMVGNQFFCDQAAHNAVYLLQYLVTGKLKSPEWQLTLPKLLCGLSYDEVLLPYRPIDSSDPYDQGQEEMDSTAIEVIAGNSQLLFECVIKRWKGLENIKEIAEYKDFTNQNILKSYFLKRLGILTRQHPDDATENKFWHLTMMHQEDDSAPLLPPWSMNSLQLPWMQEKIIFFWIPA